MKVNVLLRRAQQFKNDADLLLRKTGILNLLSKYGRIKITGSYYLNLMLNGDVDIYCISRQITKRLAVNVFNQFIKQNSFRGHLFYNFVKFRDKRFPKGYYVGLKIPFRNNKWKIDIWFLKKDDRKSSELMNLVERHLTDKNRITILKFKHYRNLNNLDIPSYKIYEAVMAKRIKSIKNFLNYFGIKKP